MLSEIDVWRLVRVLFVGLLIVACSFAPRIDASSPERLESSYSAVLESLPEKDRPRLKEAIAAIANFASGTYQDPEHSLDAASKTIEGKTAVEIIQIGTEVWPKVIQRDINQVSSEIATAESNIAAEEQTLAEEKELLGQLKIRNARFYWATKTATVGSKGVFAIEDPTVSFSITNGSKIAVKYVYLHAQLKTPGRTISAAEGHLGHEFVGGLEVGETQEVELNQVWARGLLQLGLREEQREPAFAPPIETKGRNNLELILSVVNFDGPDGTNVMKTNVRDLASKREHLIELRKTFGALQRTIKMTRTDAYPNP